MPIVLHVKGYRFYFYSNDHEPKHIHVSVGSGKPIAEVKIELETLKIVNINGFSKKDAQKILRLVEKFQDHLIELWEDYFNE